MTVWSLDLLVTMLQVAPDDMAPLIPRGVACSKLCIASPSHIVRLLEARLRPLATGRVRRNLLLNFHPRPASLLAAFARLIHV